MDKEFYCGSCGKYKPIELIMPSKTGKRKVCKSCYEKAEKNAGLSDKRREYKRDYSIKHNEKNKNIKYLLPSELDK